MGYKTKRRMLAEAEKTPSSHAMNTSFVLLLPLLFVSSGFAQAHAAPTNFIEAVRTQNTAALKSFGDSLKSDDLEKVMYDEAVFEAAEIGNYDALRYLCEHPCNLLADGRSWTLVFELAKERGDLTMQRFLLANQAVHLSRDTLEEYIIEACSEDNLKLIDMYLLYRPDMASFISRHMSESVGEILSFQLHQARVLHLLRQGRIEAAEKIGFPDDLIAYVFRPASFGFSAGIIRELFEALQERYQKRSGVEIGAAISRYRDGGSAVIAKFLYTLVAAGNADVDAFADEVIKSQEQYHY